MSIGHGHGLGVMGFIQAHPERLFIAQHQPMPVRYGQHTGGIGRAPSDDLRITDALHCGFYFREKIDGIRVHPADGGQKFFRLISNQLGQRRPIARANFFRLKNGCEALHRPRNARP